MTQPTKLIVYLILLFFASCQGQNNTSTKEKGEVEIDSVSENSPQNFGIPYRQILPEERISQFVRRIFQDKNGNFWMGTNGDGVARYNGDSLQYFSINEGFGGVAVRGIVEDKKGNVWFGTNGGLTKYDPSKKDAEAFTNYTKADGLVHNDIWNLTIDSEGIIWIGTLQGACTFDGETFSPFELPETEPDFSRGVTSSKIVHSITEDRQGRKWFGTNGGAFISGQRSLTNLSEKDGLCHNVINDILEDRDGNFWFATHHAGVCRWNASDSSVTSFGKEQGVIGTEVWSLFEDKSGNIWFPIEHSGVYRYNAEDETFTNFSEKDGLASNAVQCIFEDDRGRIWVGGHLGLFRLEGDSFVSVGKNGPWE